VSTKEENCSDVTSSAPYKLARYKQLITHWHSRLRVSDCGSPATSVNTRTYNSHVPIFRQTGLHGSGFFVTLSLI
jgi:hypothetical protein